MANWMKFFGQGLVPVESGNKLYFNEIFFKFKKQMEINYED